jgi:aerobic-type carbon monoxide dehydrogenase small subunit (CoxS/CutS family)
VYAIAEGDLLVQVARDVIKRLKIELSHDVGICNASKFVVYVYFCGVRSTVVRAKNFKPRSITSYESSTRHRDVDDSESAATAEWQVAKGIEIRLRTETDFTRIRDDDHERTST